MNWISTKAFGFIAFCQHLDTPTFAAALAVGFMISKLLLRWLVRRLAGMSSDRYEAVAWIGVDFGVISLGVSIGGRVWNAAGMSEQGIVFWYISCLLCLVFACAAYWVFLRLGDLPKVMIRRPLRFLAVSVGLFFGAGSFLVTFLAIMEGSII